MKKTIKRLIAAFTACLLPLTFAACKGKSDGGDVAGENGFLRIKAVKYGYGTDWLEDLAREFRKDKGINVVIETGVGESAENAFKSEFESGSSRADLFFSKRGFFAEKVYTGDNLYAELTDVWNSVADDGSDKTIKEKVSASYVDAFEIDGKYYSMPWAGGVLGITRNLSVWNKAGFTDADYPYTTDQLFALCDKFKTAPKTSSDVAAFIYSLESEYYSGWSTLFFAQYEGKAVADEFAEGKVDGEYTKDVYTLDGHTKAMEVLEKLVKKSNGYQYADSTESGYKFSTMQGDFIDGMALFCINGSWLENETGKTLENFDIIKTPIVSALAEKLSFSNLEKSAADAKLAEIVKYVDDTNDGKSPAKPSGVTDEDIATVKAARDYAYMNAGVDHTAYVPSYSAHIRESKEFLKYMYSDKGLSIYRKSLKGATLPATPIGDYISEVTLSAFRKSVNAAADEDRCYNRIEKSKYYVLPHLSACYTNGIRPVAQLSSGKSAAEVINANNKYISDMWNEIKKLLGIR